MAKRRSRGKDYPTEWVHVHLNCHCNHDKGNTIELGKNAYKKYDEMKGEDRVIRCGVCRVEATWEVVDDARDS